MKRFRRWRRRKAALALFPATVALSMIAATGLSAGAQSNSANFDANKAKVKPGGKVKLRGSFPAQAQTQSAGQQSADRAVRIQFRAAGKHHHWHRARKTVTDEKGHYSEKVRVRRTGFFRAVSSDGRTSDRERVRVKSKLHAKVKRKHAKIGHKVAIKGRVKPTISRRRVVVRIGGDKLKTRTNHRGRFKVKWRAHRTGRFKVRAKARGDRVAAGSRDKAGRTTVYRPAEASYYGPGFWGGRTACGRTLTPSTIGVAHKTMPCGTKLRLRYHGRTVKVRVIDRGPYSGNREFDLTEATKRKLHFPSTGTVWASK